MKQTHLLAAVLLTVSLLAAAAVITQLSPATAAPAGRGNYQVVGEEKAFVLYEADTSQSWILFPDEKAKSYVWMPIKRLDSEQEVQQWKLVNEAKK